MSLLHCDGQELVPDEERPDRPGVGGSGGAGASSSNSSGEPSGSSGGSGGAGASSSSSSGEPSSSSGGGDDTSSSSSGEPGASSSGGDGTSSSSSSGEASSSSGGASVTPNLCLEVRGLVADTGAAGVGADGSGGLLVHEATLGALHVTDNGEACWPQRLVDGGAFELRHVDPSNPRQTCTLHKTQGVLEGEARTTIIAECTNSRYMLGGTVRGLWGQGAELSLSDAQGHELQRKALSGNGLYRFDEPLANGSRYQVAVRSAPHTPAQQCRVQHASGRVLDAAVLDVDVTCQTTGAAVGGTVKSPVGSVRVQLGGASVVVPQGVSSFQLPATAGAPYAVHVSDLSEGTSCVIHQGEGTLGDGPVNHVQIVCSHTTELTHRGEPALYTVPPNVLAVEIEAFGAQGGDGRLGAPAAFGGAGGLGGAARGRLAVRGGDLLSVRVGGMGGAEAGFNGGGAGGLGSGPGGSASNPRGGGGAGGGASDVRVRGEGLEHRVLVAGGGGGGGGGGCESAVPLGGLGGGGGQGAGGHGVSAPIVGEPLEAGAGRGATSSLGGLGGVGCSPGQSGVAALADVGGAGGTGSSCCCFEAYSRASGGGGGGGYVGGGGGGGGAAGSPRCFGNQKGGGGGGAGGSSYVGGVSQGVIEAAVRSGHGLVRLRVSLP